MSKMTYICLDANIVNRFVTQGKPGCEPEHWDYILSQLNETTKLIVPEIVLMECEKFYKGLERRFKTECEFVEESILNLLKDRGKHWNEADEYVRELASHCQPIKEKHLRDFQQRHEKALGALTDDAITIQVRFTQEIWFHSRRRQIQGRAADPSTTGSSDTSIVESLVSRLNNKEDQLFLCTENTKHFALETEKNKHIIHPAFDVGENFPATEIAISLKALAALLRQKVIIARPDSAEIEKALIQEQQEQIDNDVAAIQLAHFESVRRFDVPLLTNIARLIRVMKVDSLAKKSQIDLDGSRESFNRLLEYPGIEKALKLPGLDDLYANPLAQALANKAEYLKDVDNLEIVVRGLLKAKKRRDKGSND